MARGTDHSVLLCSWRDRGHPEAGGAEVFLEHVARGLVARGWQVTIATAAYPGASDDEVVDGVRHVRRGNRLTVYLWPAAQYLLRRLGRPDVIVDVQNGVPFWACLWSRRPVVVLHHHAHREQWRTLFGPTLGRIGWWLESVAAPRLQRRARWLTVSATSRDDLVATGVPTHRVTIVHNGTTVVEAPDVEPAAEPRIVVLGRLVPHKRVELAIDAVAELADRFPGLTLDVVGGGEWRGDLVAHAASAGVTDRVTFHGLVADERKTQLLATAWVLALPSQKEGWGLVVMEAASLGVPTVAFASAGGVRESVVDGITGCLAHDQREFVASLGHLLGDADARRRMGRAAIEHSRSFTWEETVTGFDRVLTEQVVRRPA